MRVLCALALLAPLLAVAQDKSENRELIGKVGTREALLILHATQREDGSWQVAGEYILLRTLARRFVAGERSPELGVTVLREGTTPIVYGRPPTGELRGTWRDGSFKGTRHGPGGQMREEFAFTDAFPSMEGYSARVRCEAEAGRYRARLELAVQSGKLQKLEWRSTEPGGQSCSVSASGQEPMRGGLRFTAGSCRVTLRDVGEFVLVGAENCASHCAPEAFIEPVLVDQAGNCEVLRFGMTR